MYGICRPWTDEESATAAAMYAQRGKAYGSRKRAIKTIAARLERTIEAVGSRLRHCGETFASERTHQQQRHPQNHQAATPRRVHIPNDVLTDRDHRAVLDHETITAAFCGDPLPGYSARERR